MADGSLWIWLVGGASLYGWIGWCRGTKCLAILLAFAAFTYIGACVFADPITDWLEQNGYSQKSAFLLMKGLPAVIVFFLVFAPVSQIFGNGITVLDLSTRARWIGAPPSGVGPGCGAPAGC